MQKVTVKPPLIKLGQLLKFVDVISSGSDEKTFLLENVVLVNGVHETRRGRKLYHGDQIKIAKLHFVVDIDEG